VKRDFALGGRGRSGHGYLLQKSKTPFEKAETVYASGSLDAIPALWKIIRQEPPKDPQFSS
jgi:hypothetical protein